MQAALRVALTAGKSGSQPVAMPASIDSVVAAGDSITAGVSASETARRFINITSAALGATLLNQGVAGTSLTNAALASGSPASGNWRDNFVTLLFGANKRTFLDIALGVNDGRYTALPATWNAATYRAQYRYMIQRAIGNGYPPDRLRIWTPHYVTDYGFTQGGAGFTGQTRAGYEAFVQVVRDLAAEFGCYLADSYAAMQAAGAEPGLNTEGGGDGLHPGNALMAVIAQAGISAKRLPVAPINYGPGVFALDTFEDDDLRDINKHLGEYNALWTAQTGYSIGNFPRISGGRLFGRSANNVMRASGAPPTADYEVEANFQCITSVANDQVSVCARMEDAANSFYFLRYAQGQGWQLFKTIAGTSTAMGAVVVDAFNTPGAVRNARLRVQGATVSGYVDGVLVSSVTDTAITAKGAAGIRMPQSGLPTALIHMDDFKATAI